VLADPLAFQAAIHPDDRSRIEAATRRLWSGSAVSDEYRILRPDGSVRHIRDRAVLVKNPTDGRQRAIGLAADVTEWRRVEERLQLATEAAGIGIFDVDLRTGVIEWDARLRELWGVTPDVLITDEVFNGGLHPDDRPAMRAAIERAVRPGGDGVYRAEYRLLRPEGEASCWIAATGRVHYQAGRAVRLIGTVQDISARKAAEAAMAESEERFRALANTVPALIFVSTPGQGNTYSNERYQSFTGLGREGLLGDAWRRVIHPEDHARVADAWSRSWATGQDYAVEVRVRRHDGVYRWHLTRGIPIHDAQGRIVQWVGTGTDIEEIVEAREALAASRVAIQEANAELEKRVAERTASLAEANTRLAAEIERREAVQAALVQSQKLEAVGQLTSGIAHDFNNVIAAIAGGFSVIERRTSDPRLLEVARHGAKAAERGGALVKQLLAFARQQVLTPRPCDLAALLTEAEPLIARSLGPRIELRIDCPAELRLVRVDPVQLEAALINLAVNARDAMEEGGRVLIEARSCQVGDPGHPEYLQHPAVVLRMSDTGAGMTPEVLARALDPFFTTKEPGRGTGLGLAMVHGFVHQSGGALRIDSQEGQGTTVTLWLPEALETEESLPIPAEIPARDVAEGTTVLLVDDDAAVRGVTAAQLQDAGYEVLEAGCAEEALALLEARDGIAIVLSDVAMPGTDGVELAAQIRLRQPGLPILFMTGHADRARLLGEAVIDKPFTLGVLLAALAERLSRRL
jgi:PAS domain S-box-containing protein